MLLNVGFTSHLQGISVEFRVRSGRWPGNQEIGVFVLHLTHTGCVSGQGPVSPSSQWRCQSAWVEGIFLLGNCPYQSNCMPRPRLRFFSMKPFLISSVPKALSNLKLTCIYLAACSLVAIFPFPSKLRQGGGVKMAE